MEARSCCRSLITLLNGTGDRKVRRTYTKAAIEISAQKTQMLQAAAILSLESHVVTSTAADAKQTNDIPAIAPIVNPSDVLMTSSRNSWTS